MNIKDKLKQFGIWVISAISPGLRKKGTQRLGIMILGLGLMFGVSQASALRRAISGIMGGESAIPQQTASFKNTEKNTVANPETPAVSVQTEQTETVSSESNVGPANIVDLIADSETIISGMVKEVTDGFENGVPYTQVTVQVSETLRGQVGEEYTFRQFGLTKPRRMENGKIYLGTTPEGWSKYETGEDTMLFLYQRASITGLQTTVGLGQGKIVFKGGNAVSQNGNEGMFENVDADARLLNDRDKRLLATKKGDVNADGFKSFVRRAVNNKWVEGGKLRHVKK
jgi:Tfp pilus assembly protein PilX